MVRWWLASGHPDEPQVFLIFSPRNSERSERFDGINNALYLSPGQSRPMGDDTVRCIQ